MEIVLPSHPFRCDACGREEPAATLVHRRNRLGVNLQLCRRCAEELERRYGPSDPIQNEQ